MNENTISGDLIGVALRQLGADSVREIRSMMHIANFMLDDGAEVTYVFNITKGDRYFLQRMRPYAMPWGMFADENQIIRFIRQDIEKFRNAHRSRNFQKFIETEGKVSGLVDKLEALFLSCNVDSAEFDALGRHLDALEAELDALRERSKPV